MCSVNKLNDVRLALESTIKFVYIPDVICEEPLYLFGEGQLLKTIPHFCHNDASLSGNSVSNY